MTCWGKRTGIAMAMACIASTAWAQEVSTNRVSAQTDWSVFVEENPKECWGVSAPKDWTASRGGSDVTSSVRRGDIRLFVTFRPGSGAAGEVAYTGGYPFSSDRPAVLEVGGNEYEMFTDGEWAWPASAEEDSELVAALKAGSEATITAISSRGTTTRDTFSLMGFTAAMEDAEQRCAAN